MLVPSPKSMYALKKKKNMGSLLLSSSFSLDIYKTILILTFQIVCNISCGFKDSSTSSLLNPYNNNSIKHQKLVRFDDPPPKYPAGDGEFGRMVIDLGGLKVFQALYFKKIWETKRYGPEDTGAQFYQPAILPKGFSLLGHYCRPRNTPTFSSLLIVKSTLQGALTPPLDYTLLWTSNASNVGQSVDGYIWLPIAPDGYKVLGHIVTTSPQKPPLDKVMCVRSDFTDSIDVDKWLWGNDILEDASELRLYTTKPRTRDRSVPAGTFLAQTSSRTHELACLKMVKSDAYTAMPNPLQIKKMIESYAPWVYLHPDEKYFPSSVSWFFRNGAELHQPGKAYSEPVMNDGDNLPDNGTPDDAFLDLPSDEATKEKIKTGSLENAASYVHVKPALGGTFTDIVIWLYYPFNGAGMLQLGPIAINLGIIGEHVSDWEHITLRIDNFYGSLKGVYLSQHAKGVWLTPRDFETNGTRPIVYASLHGHSHFSTPTSHIHLLGQLDPVDVRMLQDEIRKMNMNNSSRNWHPIVIGGNGFGFGPVDVAEKSDEVLDVASTYVVVYTDHFTYHTIHPWLKYTGRWGPKISYEFTKEVLRIAEHMSDNVKKLILKLLSKLPPELLGEEGPPGPMMKDSWLGDERV